MARRGHGCRCCGCSFNNIFRCEQLSVNLWNQSGELPVVTCDSAPAAGNLTAVSQWIASGAFARGGSLTIDLDAAGLNLAASSTGNGSIQTSLFQGTAIASSAISGSVRSISMNSDQRLAVFDQTHAISVRSCKTQSGRFVTAYAGATPRSTDVPGITPRMSVKFRQQGEPGFTSQFIDGLWNPGGDNPYWMTQACRAAVYRDGEYVETVTRNPSLCVFLPDESATVSRSGPPADDTAARQAAISALEAERASIQPQADQNAGLRTQLSAEWIAIDQRIAQLTGRSPVAVPGIIPWFQQSIANAQDQTVRQQFFSDPKMAFTRSWNLLTNVIVWGKLPEEYDEGGCNGAGPEVASTCAYYIRNSGVISPEGIYDLHTTALQQRLADYQQELAAKQGELSEKAAQLAAIPLPPGLTQAQRDRIDAIALQLASLRAGPPYDLIDYIAASDGIVRLAGRNAGRIAVDSQFYLGGARLPGIGTGIYYLGMNPTVAPDLADARYFYVRQGERFRIAILDGGYASLSIEPSGAILGTFDDETSPEGSYLVVARYDDDCMPSGWQGQLNFDNLDDGWQGLGGYRSYPGPFGVTVIEPRRLSQRRYEFNSFVVDKTPPSIVARQVNDFVAGDWPTEVNVASADYFTGVYRIEASPLFVADEPVVGGFTHRAEYVTRPAVMGDPGFYRATNPLLKDRAHNFPQITPAVEFTIHEEMSGARATFVAQGENETLRTSPLTTLDIEFDKPVVGVLKRHFTIEAYGRRDDNTFGQIATGSVIESVAQHDETTFRLLLKAEKQLAGAQWRITFQPDGDVVADVGESTEPCILAARFAWIRPQENVRQLIDTTSGSQFTIGDIASVSASVAEPDPEQPPVMALSSSSTVSLPASGGSFHANHDADSFSPNAPPDPDTGTAVPFSYFGMSTTIYPSPAKLLSACAAPLEQQKHFSAMMAANNLTTITAQMATHVPVNGKTYAGRLVVPDTTGRPHAQFSPNWETIAASIEELISVNRPAGYNLAAYFLQRWFFGPLSFTANSGFGIASQNQWSAAGSSEQYVTVIRGETRQRLGIFDIVPVDDIGELYFTRGSASMAATRVVQEYAGLSTASPGDLVLAMRVPVTTRVAIERLMRVLDYVETPKTGSPINHYKWEMQSFPNYASASQTYEAVFHLSKAQEYALASGDAVQVVVANTSSRATPVTDPNSPIPGGIEDINRHVWTLQAS